MSYSLPSLPYSLDALNPYISKQTLEFHHGKHLLAYVNNLNGLIQGTKFEDASLETIIKESDGGIFNNAAQCWNHTFYFNSLSPKPKEAPEGELMKAIERDFGSVEALRDELTKASATLFGSGWSWLAMNKDERLVVVQKSNAGNPLTEDMKPLIAVDVWEHSYYLDYQNRRPDYIQSLWKLLDWAFVEERFKE